MVDIRMKMTNKTASPSDKISASFPFLGRSSCFGSIICALMHGVNGVEFYVFMFCCFFQASFEISLYCYNYLSTYLRNWHRRARPLIFFLGLIERKVSVHRYLCCGGKNPRKPAGYHSFKNPCRNYLICPPHEQQAYIIIQTTRDHYTKENIGH